MKARFVNLVNYLINFALNVTKINVFSVKEKELHRVVFVKSDKFPIKQIILFVSNVLFIINLIIPNLNKYKYHTLYRNFNLI